MIERARYAILITSTARKDIEKLSPSLRNKLKEILQEVVARNPWEGKKLLGDLAGRYSYRLTYKDRIVYTIDESQRIVYIERARTHYGD